MNVKLCKRLACILMASFLLLGYAIPTFAAEPFEEKHDVQRSDKAYSVILTNASDIFVYNKKPVDLTVGKQYYMVYTVDEVSHNDLSLAGVAIGQEGNTKYPYVNGKLQYSFGTKLFEVGATYFCRMEVTEEGLSYVVAKKSQNESKWMELPLSTGKTTDDCKYFGLWLGQRVSAKLSNVMCYDEKGTDLGVTTHQISGSGVTYDSAILKEKTVGQWYEFSLDNSCTLAVSNQRPAATDTIYMSYTVANLKQNKATQTGVGNTNNPKAQYPHTSGLLNYAFCKGGSSLLEEGAKYFVCAMREGDSITVLVRKTLNGKEEVFTFPNYTGKIKDDSNFFYLWFGDGTEAGVTADIKDFRCYDKNGKNLGVQTNISSIKIQKYGEIEDYSLCEAVYWCEKNNKSLILDDEQNIGLKDESGETETVWSKYSVQGSKLTMAAKSGNVVYDYQYTFVKDTDGNKYVRLNDTKVTFVTGMKEHEGNKTVDVTATDGYKVKQPDEPKVEGYTFEEWCLADGSSFDFDRYVTESVSLYAKYVDGDGHEYLTVDAELHNGLGSINGTLLTIAICASVVLVTGLVILYIHSKGRKKND